MTNQPIHLLLPMSGQGSRFKRAGYAAPKPLIEVSGTPMVERLLANFPAHWPCTFVLAKGHEATGLPALLARLRPSGRQLYVDHATPSPDGLIGPARAARTGLKDIPAGAPVLVSYCDYAMEWDPTKFERFVRATSCDACVVSYRGFHAHYLSPQMYAYSRMEGELVREVKEKGCFTGDREREYASCGAYYFGSAKTLSAALDHQAGHDTKLNGEDYVSLTVQALLEQNPKAHVRIFEIPGFCQWGTPEDLRIFEYWEKTFTAWNRDPHGRHYSSVEQVLMPMAGLGSRFSTLTPVPKPLIDVAGTPMFVAALQSIPGASHTVIVALKEHRKAVEGHVPNTRFVWLDATPAGQALSTLEGVPALDQAKPVIVTACDHEIVLSDAKWQAFKAMPDCDAAIFTVQGFPGALRRPEAFAYVVPSGSSPFPEVRSVSVKKPVSATPDRDHLLVGTFWFKSGKTLADGIAALQQAGARVNGELYLDSVFTEIQKAGGKVRMIPLDGYINRGDPDSLAESLYYQELFGGRRLSARPRLPFGGAHGI